MVPELAIALRLTVPVPQRSPGVTPVMLGIAFMVAVTATLEVEVHDPLVSLDIINRG